MNRVTFFKAAFDEYIQWQEEDRKTLKRINRIIRDICRNGYEGIGQTEQLKDDLSGWFSKRIDGYNRIVFRVSSDQVEILQCGTHYKDD